MGSEDRDRRFEKALSRHLSTAARSGEAPSASSDTSFQTPVCFDPEFLAAYHEGALPPGEMNSAKEHLVGCARCQSILAELETTDSIPLAVGAEREPGLSASPEKTRSALPIRGARWAWLVPAGALAAGLLVWIGLHEHRPKSLLSEREETKVAKAQQGAAAAEPAPPAPVGSSPFEALSKSPAGAGGVSGGEQGRTSESLKRPEKRLPRVIAAPIQPAVDKESDLRQDALRDSSGAPPLAQNKPELDAKIAAAGQATEKAELQSQSVNNQVQNQEQVPPSISRSVPAPAMGARKSQSEANANARLDAAPAAPAPASDQVTGFTSSTAMREASASSNPRLIVAPGATVRWRAGRAGMIDFSGNGGASWSRQVSGVLADLTAGSAPSAKICWIVGRAGTIVLTTDGGARWSAIPSPLEEDLGGVSATDALHATIWNARNTKSFATADGGRTWKLLPTP